MEMKKLHMGTISYGWDSMDEVASQLASVFGELHSPGERAFFFSEADIRGILMLGCGGCSYAIDSGGETECLDVDGGSVDA